MKIFKRIYYPIMALILILLLIFSLVDTNVGTYKKRYNNQFFENVTGHIEELALGGRNEYNSNHLDNSKIYIRQILTSNGLTKLTDSTLDEDDNKVTADIALGNDGKLTATTTVQKVMVSDDTQRLIKSKTDNEFAIAKEVNNIITIIPGTDSKSGVPGDIVMMMAHYDSVHNGAMDNASSVANMMETVKYIIENNLEYKNDLMFVFTDAQEDGLYGSYAFMHQFKGFNNAPSRVKLGTNFDSFGNGGSYALVQISDNNSNLLKSYKKINKGTFASTVTKSVFKENTDFEVYGDIPSLGFANIGGTKAQDTLNDTFENINKGIIKQQADMMYKIYNNYGSYDLSKLTSKNNSAIFSFLDIFTVTMPAVVSIVIGVIILCLMIAIILINMKKKAFNLGKAGVGALAQILSVAGTVIMMFVFYFLISMMLSGFGVIPFRTIPSINYTNVAVLLFSMILSGAVMTGFYLFFKKTFNVAAKDVVRGNALIWALIGMILSFASVSVAYVFSIIAVLELTVMLVITIVRDKYKAKFGQDIERLFLYIWPMILCLPLVIPVMSILAVSWNTVLIPVIIVLFLMMAGSILPYANYLKPKLTELVKKLPPKTIRYERIVTERVEDAAKKGRFTEVTSKKVIKEKVPMKYYNRAGIAIVACICAVALIISGAFTAKYNDNIHASAAGYNNFVYDGSIVYVYEEDNGSVTNRSIQVKDIIAYKYISRYVRGMKWDSGLKAYTKDYNDNLLGEHSKPSFSKTDLIYTFVVFDPSFSKVEFEITGASNIHKFTFSQGTGSGGAKEMEFINENNLDVIKFTMPRGYGNFTMEVEMESSTATPSLTFDYFESCVGSSIANNITDLIKLREKYASNNKVLPYLNGEIVFKITKTV